jgi:glycosyltransferase involved in cell wall biosynthesis
LLPALYSGAIASIYLSLYEGFGLPPLEAMACGTPVLTSNVASLPEVVGEAAITVDPLDVEAIADGLIRLVEDSALRFQLRSLGLNQARGFSWDKTANETWKVLQEAARL